MPVRIWLNPEFSDERVDACVTKVELKLGDLHWNSIGYNLADANQVAIDKAVKFLKW